MHKEKIRREKLFVVQLSHFRKEQVEVTGSKRSAGEQPLEMVLAKGYIHDLRWSVLLSFTCGTNQR